MVPFKVVCPVLASDEVRTITIAESEFLPRGTYALAEFCCKEVALQVLIAKSTNASDRRGSETATDSGATT